MTTTQGVWMTRRTYIRLQAELAGLRSQPAIEVPDDFMDYDDHVVAHYRARQARIGQIHDLLANAIVGDDSPDDGVAQPGMVLTVRYDDTGDTETFLLGVRGAEDADIGVYSAQSPLGSAIGARPGEQRTSSIPSKDNVAVTLLAQCLTGCTYTNGLDHSRFPLEGADTAAPQPPSPAGTCHPDAPPHDRGARLLRPRPGDVRPVPSLDETDNK